MSYHPVRSGRLYYETAGKGEPLILLPGLGGSGKSWTHQIGPLSQRFLCVTYDHIGTGRSDRWHGPYSVDGMADDLLELMDALSIRSAHLIGHSTGGAIAQTIACRTPERVRSLVLLASWSKADAYFRWIFAMRRQVLLGCGVEAYLRGTAFFLYPPWWINQHEAEVERGIQAGLAENPDRDILASRIDAILAFDRADRLAGLTAPTLVTGAANDVLVPRHYLTDLAARIPGALLDILPDGGHVPHQTTPEAFRRRVLCFLDEEQPPQRPAPRLQHVESGAPCAP